MTEAIGARIKDLEDLYLAEQKLIVLRAGRSRIYTLEEVTSALDLPDRRLEESIARCA